MCVHMYIYWACRGQGGPELYIAFNAHGFECRITLPQPPHGQHWAR